MFDALNNTRKIGGHFDSLLGERPAGSRWGRAFIEADFALPWREAQPADAVRQPGCRYFVLDGDAFAVAFPRATLGAVPYSSLTDAQRTNVYRANGAHGVELRIDTLAPGRPAEAWVIIGDHDGDQVIFTVHPGRVMLPCPDGQLDSTQPYAVKLP